MGGGKPLAHNELRRETSDLASNNLFFSTFTAVPDCSGAAFLYPLLSDGGVISRLAHTSKICSSGHSTVKAHALPPMPFPHIPAPLYLTAGVPCGRAFHLCGNPSKITLNSYKAALKKDLQSLTKEYWSCFEVLAVAT
jgi:hypothetical protein